MKIYIIDYSDRGSWMPVFPPDTEWRIGNKDGGKAYAEVGHWLPDLILVNMETKPSHGFQTASAINKRKSTAQIPIWFVQTPASYLAKTEGLGDAIEIETILQRITQV